MGVRVCEIYDSRAVPSAAARKLASLLAVNTGGAPWMEWQKPPNCPIPTPWLTYIAPTFKKRQVQPPFFPDP
jgi:hypothetical protein